MRKNDFCDERLLATAFPNEPFQEEVIGEDVDSEGIDAEDLRNHFGGKKSWREISLEAAISGCYSLSFFDGAAFRYFLPCFLRYAKESVDVAHFLRDFIVDQIQKEKIKPGSSVLSGLSLAQDECVRSFLERQERERT